MKYIDADKLIAEIERRLQENADKALVFGPAFAGRTVEDNVLKNLVASLQQEQPEVVLEKEVDQWRHDHFKGERDGHYSGEYLERESQLDIARHFFELGLNAREK